MKTLMLSLLIGGSCVLTQKMYCMYRIFKLNEKELKNIREYTNNKNREMYKMCEND